MIRIICFLIIVGILLLLISRLIYHRIIVDKNANNSMAISVGGTGGELSYIEDESNKVIIEQCMNYTMLQITSLLELIDMVNSINDNDVHGDIVECGVWKGGASMAMILAQKKFNQDRKFYMYDTFEHGMPQFGENDAMNLNNSMYNNLYNYLFKNRILTCVANMIFATTMTEARNNVHGTGYDKNNLLLIKGDVKKTLEAQAPDKISILRLDTDFYDSTLVELQILFPKLARGGFLIIDDYYTFKGSKQATDEYFENRQQMIKEYTPPNIKPNKFTKRFIKL